MSERCFIYFTLLLLIFARTGRADFVFEFADNATNQAGSDLDGLHTGTTSITMDGITVTMDATASSGAQGDHLFNQNGPATVFGIDVPGIGDPPDRPAQFDEGDGAESMTFSFTASVPVTFHFEHIQFGLFTSVPMDAASLDFDGGSSFALSNSTNVNNIGLFNFNGTPESFMSGQDITLAWTGGNGFSVETFKLNVAAIPEPSSFLMAGLLACLVACWRVGKR